MFVYNSGLKKINQIQTNFQQTRSSRVNTTMVSKKLNQILAIGMLAHKIYYISDSR